MPRNDAVSVTLTDVIHAAIQLGIGPKAGLDQARAIGITIRDEAFYRRFREEQEWIKAKMYERRMAQDGS